MQQMYPEDVEMKETKDISQIDLIGFKDQMRDYAEAMGQSFRSLAESLESLSRPVQETKDYSGGSASVKPHKRAAADRRHARKKVNRRRK